MRLSLPTRHTPLVVPLLLALVVALAPRLVAEGPPPAGAAVAHGNGFAGVVDGFRSWYGSYLLGDHGEVWCVDHGIAAPDEALGYQPTALDDRAPETRRAVAWAAGRFGPGSDRVTAAALMLALHDLMGARYPSGPLSVEALTPAKLEGFEGHAAVVIERARQIKSEAVAHAHLTAPMELAVEADPVPAGGAGELRVRLTDAAGSPLAGVLVHPAVEGAELLGAVDAETDADGRATWSYRAGPGDNRFEVTAGLPGGRLLALGPTGGTAQRVVAPAVAHVAGSTRFDAVVPRRFSIVKRGDAEPRVPVAGARFTVGGHELVVGEDGRTPAVELLPGTYVVTETAPPPGYAAAGPWTVVVHDADVVFEVTNAAVPGDLDIVKVDAVTGAVVEGASFVVRGDLDADPATFEHEVASWADGLLPGRYEVREVDPPPHYRHDPAPRVVEVHGRERTTLRFENVPLATVAFEKRPALPGAVFAVRSAGVEIGRCTTDGSGRCALADDAVEGGAAFCWEEVVAPPGWGLAEGGCLTAGGAGTTTTVAVDEPPLPSASPPPPAATAETPPPEVERPASALAAPEPAPTTTALGPGVAAPGRPGELPRTGVTVGRLAGGGLVVGGVGVLLVATATGGASSSGTPGRRATRRRRSSTGGGRCRP